MLHRKRNIFIFLALAVIAISMGIQTSLANFNQDIGYQQPIKAFECYKTTDGWYISALNSSFTVEKSQVAQVLQPVITAIDNFPVEKCQHYQQIAQDKIASYWQQAVNSNPLETVRCLTNDIIDKVDSR